MSFDNRKKKSWSNESGVSEIVGNILILMITVMLFSSIMVFVQNMPMPEQLTKATFSAGITFDSDGTHANLTVTHAGGATMKADKTMIIVERNTTSTGYNLNNDSGLGGAAVWKTGMTWTKRLDQTTYSSVITVTVVDMEKHAQVWSSQVTGGTGMNPPMIGQRWVDSDITTPTPDPVLEWSNFSLFVTISDPDKDLNTNAIWINTQQLEGTSAQYAQRKPSAPPNGDVYRWDFLDVKARGLSAAKLDGAIIIIHAEDKAASPHVSQSTFVMTITELPVNPIPINPIYNTSDQTGSDAGFPNWVTNRYGTLGWEIFGELKSGGVGKGTANTSDRRTNFVKDERVFIRVASTTGSDDTLNNLQAGNTLAVMDSRTGMAYTPNYTGSSNVYPPQPFYSIPYSGNAYVYECQFSTNGLPPGTFGLHIVLKNAPSAGKPQVTFDQLAAITVNQTGNTIQFIPTVTLSKHSNFTGVWGTRTDPFVISSSDSYKIYVSVRVQNSVYPPSPSCTEIRIIDMTGAAELYGVPPSGPMISKIYSMADGLHYNFTIDLRMNNGAQWRSGTNTYTILITKLNDTNEGLYSLAKQVFISGAGARSDFFAGTTGLGTGNGNFNSPEYVYYIENNNLFTRRTLWLAENTPSGTVDYTVTAMAVGDVNGDGHKDLLAAQAYTNSLLLFTNTLDSFGTWQSASAIYRPDGLTNKINAIAFGDVNGDGHDDFVYGAAGSPGAVVIYNTTYGSRGWLFNPTGTKWTGAVTKLALKDMTGDGQCDLVILAGGRLYVYDLRYSTNPALKSQESTKALFSRSVGTSTVDFDIGDVNNDTHLDFVTMDTTNAAYSGGLPGVNVNYYTLAPGSKVLMQNSTYNLVGYVVHAGTKTNGTIQATEDTGGAFLTFQENGTDGGVLPPYSSSVNVTMKSQTLSNSPDQLLRIRARIGDFSGNPGPGEVFYVWYSIDGGIFIPVITVDKASWTTYDYWLPGSVMGKQIYVKVTDSLTTDSGQYKTFIMIDHLAIYSNLFSAYSGQTVIADTTRTTVRAAAIDGPTTTARPYLEIVAAKDSRWDCYLWSSAMGWQNMTGQPRTDATMFTRAGTPGAAKTAYLDGIAPTLFRTADINSDGYTDIVVTNYTAPTGYDNSYVGYYMNLYSGSGTYWRYFSVTQWILPYQGNDPKAWVDIVLAANLNS